MKKFLRIKEIREISPPRSGGHRYELSFELGEMSSGEFRSLGSHKVLINTSRTLQSVWDQSDTQVVATSATTATSMILSAASEGFSGELDPIQLNTYTAPETPPTHPHAIPGAVIAIPEPEKKDRKKTGMSFLSDDISELRDQINALARNLLGERLLELPQERAILDVYKPARSPEEFRNRVQSLAGICTAINKSLIGKYLENKSTQDIGSINLLEELLSKFGGSDKASNVCGVLKNINELRKGYPTHGDNTDKFLAAHDFFDIPYPISEFETSWEKILGAYFHSMKLLLEIMVQERNNRGS